MNSNFTLQKPIRRSGQVRPYQVEPEDTFVGLRNGIDIVIRSRGLVIAVMLVVTLLGTMYALVKKPIYEGNMLIQVAEKRSGERKNTLGDTAATLDRETTAASEIGVLRSRKIVTKVVDSLKLHIEAKPKYLFFIGARISAMREGLSTPGIAGRDGYCWGAESILVSEFEVPEQYFDKEFVVTREGGGQFRLTEKLSKIDVLGSIGVPVKIQFVGGGVLALNVAAIEARQGAQFLVKRKSKLALVEGIQKAMVVTETGKESGSISVSLRDVEPQSIYALLNELGNEYIREYQERKTKAAEKSLALLESQLPGLKRRMESSEANYNVFRNRNGTADLNEETKLRVQRLAGSEQSLLELEQKRSELLMRFSPAHHVLLGIDSQIGLLVAEKKSLAERIQRFPLLEQELGRLTREVKVTTELYTNLLRTAQELRLVSLEKADDVRIVDVPVVPDLPVNPRSTIITLSAALGLLLGLFGAFLKRIVVF